MAPGRPLGSCPNKGRPSAVLVVSSKPNVLWSLDQNQNRLLAALTIAAARELTGDTLFLSEDNRSPKARMARVQDIVLFDYPADKEAPRLICVYLVDLLDARNGGKQQM